MAQQNNAWISHVAVVPVGNINFNSDNQIFVEGYTDQQMFASLLPYIHTDLGVAGTGIIDVGGKDELGVFCKVCALLGTNSRIITDLDSLFGGKLRDVFCSDERATLWLEKQKEKQFPFYQNIFTAKELDHEITMEKLILRLERFLSVIGKELCQIPDDSPLPPDIELFVSKLKALDQKHAMAENIDTFKTVVLQGVMAEGGIRIQLEQVLKEKTAQSLPLVRALFSLVLAGAAAASVYILPRGCIEHYYTQSLVEYMPVSAKDKLFHAEREHILTAKEKTVRKEYSELIGILESAAAR